MVSTALPDGEAKRLAILESYGILDTPVEKSFDDVVMLLSQLLDVPIAAVNLIAGERQWFKAEVGLGTREMPLDDSICKFAILQPGVTVIPDTREDERFDCNALVTGDPGLRFYAGARLETEDGVALGTLCALDLKPREAGLTAHQQFVLETLAQQIMSQIELRKSIRDQQTLLVKQVEIQRELEIERDQSRQLLEGMDEGFVFLDKDFRVRQINAGGLRFEERSADDILGKTHWEAWPGSESVALGENYRRAMRERVPVVFETNYAFPDGRSYWVDIRAYPANGGLAVFYRDITERKLAETRSRQTAERLEFTLKAAEIGDWDLDLVNDTSHRSLRHDQCFGYAQPIENWGRETFIQHVHPDDRQYVMGKFEESLAQMRDWQFECRVVWPDETVHWIAVHGSVYGSDAEPTRMSGIVVDITERKRVEEELRESQSTALAIALEAENERRRLDTLLEVVPAGIIVADGKGALLNVNAENRRIWGAHPMSANNSQYTEWKGWWADGSDRHGQPLGPEDWAMSRALNGEPAPRQVIEIESFSPPHERRIILNCGRPIRTSSGEIDGAIIAQMDITDRIKAENALREADQRKDEFLAMLAHELRNPLAPIASAAAILAGTGVDASTVRRTSAVIARQAQHMTSLIEDLLDVSRVTRGKIDIENLEVDLKDVVADALEQVRPLIEKHHHQLSVQLAPDAAMVIGDRKRLVQIMTNLFNNAAKYTPEGGEIRLVLETSGDDIDISVSDNGIGMSAELIAQAFDLFSQGDRGLDRSQGGLGIGLALVRSLLELHGGAISVHSDGPGLGSTFKVTLPKASGNRASDHVRPRQEMRHTPVLRIAVVDDNEDAAATLSLLLETLGHTLLTANSAEDALSRLPEFSPDVCLLDIGLPDMNGYALAQALREAPSTAGAVLVAVTGYAQERNRREALAAGFDDLFPKPVDLTALKLYLAQIANHRLHVP
ncbi:MAG: hypothetical protein CME36_13605 [unclassified Hahellaceae]|nr:hypothetical protein [Hahellaceae bacterium]|tara:strand:+ start:9343 stop:12213 length:2871 start_codon:yes stop_codon:yes gene_type:complete